VLLFGADRLLFSKLSVPASIERPSLTTWLAVALGLVAAYSAGVFLRLLGTCARILVIAPVVGCLGDPWDLRAGAGGAPTWLARLEWLWRSRDEAAVVARYGKLYPPRSDRLAMATDREAVFLNLAGTLGLALFAVGLTSALAPLLLRVGLFVRPLSSLVTALLLGGGIVFIVGHYMHARAIHLLNKL